MGYQMEIHGVIHIRGRKRKRILWKGDEKELSVMDCSLKKPNGDEEERLKLNS